MGQADRVPPSPAQIWDRMRVMADETCMGQPDGVGDLALREFAIEPHYPDPTIPDRQRLDERVKPDAGLEPAQASAWLIGHRWWWRRR
jgi:hypothetical protein